MGQKMGLVPRGYYTGVLGPYSNQTRMPGLVTNLVSMEEGEENWIFAGASPGRFMNIMPIDPMSRDSDFDGMPDGWEFLLCWPNRSI